MEKKQTEAEMGLKASQLHNLDLALKGSESGQEEGQEMIALGVTPSQREGRASCMQKRAKKARIHCGKLFGAQFNGPRE